MAPMMQPARAYRDAIITAIPPATNHEQAVLLRKNNESGISGVRRVKTREGDVWQATLMTNEGQKRENFSVSKFGEHARNRRPSPSAVNGLPLCRLHIWPTPITQRKWRKSILPTT